MSKDIQPPKCENCKYYRQDWLDLSGQIDDSGEVIEDFYGFSTVCMHKKAEYHYDGDIFRPSADQARVKRYDSGKSYGEGPCGAEGRLFEPATVFDITNRILARTWRLTTRQLGQ